MSNLLVNQIEEGSEAGKNSRGDGHHIRPVSIKMLEIAEKLETLNKECQILNVENKGKVDITIRVVFTILKYYFKLITLTTLSHLSIMFNFFQFCMMLKEVALT